MIVHEEGRSGGERGGERGGGEEGTVGCELWSDSDSLKGVTNFLPP